jgi:hypothetical protein
MNETVEIVVSPEEREDLQKIHRLACQRVGVNPAQYSSTIVKSSIDARKRPVFRLQVVIHEANETALSLLPVLYPDVRQSAVHVLIVGSGPAGLFCALKLIEQGIKPIIWERGHDVRQRRRDLAAITKNQEVNPESNYCFGEGGAGTYSDGKLYTRSTKRGDVKSILQALVQFGADQNILIESHPHIGTNKLPQVITQMREQIIASGGEVQFSKKFVDFKVNESKKLDAFDEEGNAFSFDDIVLATGHSARDIFELLHNKGLEVQFKSFALGVRVEHPQSVIDAQQYHCEVRHEALPAAAYSWVEQVNGRGVYSFCMCPGGIIAPCATDKEEVVTNGWSPSKRNNPWANSGIVVPVQWEDIPEFHSYGPLAGLRFQQSVERACWQAAGETQRAPAQRLLDFLRNKTSAQLPTCSYLPGVVSKNLHDILPPFIAQSLKKGFEQVGRKMKTYLHPDAILVAPESRTSSPVRIPRDPENLAHPQMSNLYPCAEGAGYAGGIISAAIDGVRIAETLSLKHANRIQVD